MPHANELARKYRDQGLVIIGICSSDTRDRGTMEDAVKDWGIEFPVASDIENRTVQTYRVNSFPDYYFIDRAGNLRIVDCANGKVEDAIKMLLAEKVK